MYFPWVFHQFSVLRIAAALQQCSWIASESNDPSWWNWTFLLTVGLMMVRTLCTSLRQIFHRRFAECFPNLWSGCSKGTRLGLALAEVSDASWFPWALPGLWSPGCAFGWGWPCSPPAPGSPRCWSTRALPFRRCPEETEALRAVRGWFAKGLTAWRGVSVWERTRWGCSRTRLSPNRPPARAPQRPSWGSPALLLPAETQPDQVF